MSGYIIAGYFIILGTLAAYASSLIGRQRAIRRRLQASPLHRPEAHRLETEPGEGDGAARGELA